MWLPKNPAELSGRLDVAVNYRNQGVFIFGVNQGVFIFGVKK